MLVRNDGEVKLLDFGIAKLLAEEGDPASATMLTIEGGGALTPRFATPEQVTGGNITTATDVYALGVLLYLLLTGEHPAGVGVHSPADLVRAIVEIEAPRASSTVSVRNAAAQKRSVAAERLRRQLSGDLDTIIGKALKKNPQERYASVSVFADDLRRYLSHEAISVRPDTFAYRTAKFLRRHRAMVSLTTVAIALVIGSLSAGLLIANRERKIAEQRFAQVRQLANKFIALDNEIRGLPGSTKIRMQMVSDSLQYLTSLGGDVHGDKELALEIAYAYVRVAHAQGDPNSANLGQFAEAEISLQKAENFVDSVLSIDPTNRRALATAATIAHDRMALADEQNKKEEMVSWADKASERIERFMKLGYIDAKDVYGMGYFEQNIAYTYDDARRFESALRAAQRALSIIQPVASAQRVRGSILGAPRKALSVYDKALARIGEAKTSISTQLYSADLLAASSYAVRWIGQDEQANRRITEAFQFLRDAHQYPADSIEPMSRVDHVFRAKADDYAETGQTAKAIETYQELLDKLLAWKPDVQNDLRDATCISRTWTALANLLKKAGRMEEARHLEEQRAELWNHWDSKLPNAQFLLRQSLSQVSLDRPALAGTRH